MKFYKFQILILALSFLFAVNFSRAQVEEIKEQEEMDEDQWEAQILELTAKKNELAARIAEMTKESNQLSATNETKAAELKQTEEAFWRELGGKEAYYSFRNDLERLERLCNTKQGTKDDAEKIFDVLNSSKVRCHPDFFDRFKKVKVCMDNWQSSVPEYTILRGEYLFVIAAKKEIYNNHHMWPIIWEANENGVISAPRGIPKKIKNPHMVYPGQVLRIPKMTDSLKKSDIFERAKGWLDWRKGRMHKKAKK